MRLRAHFGLVRQKLSRPRRNSQGHHGGGRSIDGDDLTDGRSAAELDHSQWSDASAWWSRARPFRGPGGGFCQCDYPPAERGPAEEVALAGLHTESGDCDKFRMRLDSFGNQGSADSCANVTIAAKSGVDSVRAIQPSGC
jgi:hypothetical protein